MANDYRILDERDIKNFQAGNKLNVTEIDNKVTYEHIGEPPNKLPLQEQALEYGSSFDITVPSVYDSTGHVKSETTYSFKMPDKVDTSNGLTKDIFGDMDNNPVSKKEENNKIIYYHDDKTITNSTPASATELTYGGEFSVTALSAADGYGHATEQKTYKFKMPAAPNVNTSGFITKDTFGDINNNPVSKKEESNKIIYYHDDKTITNSTQNLAPKHNDVIKITASHGLDSTGHAGSETTYNITMPSMTENYLTKEMRCNDNTYTYECKLDFYYTSFIIISLQPKIPDTTQTSYYMAPGFYTFFMPTYGRSVFCETRDYYTQLLHITTADNKSVIATQSSKISIVPQIDHVKKIFSFSVQLQHPHLFDKIIVDAY